MNPFLIFIAFMSLLNGLSAQEITVELQPDAVSFLEGADSILVYQVAEKSLDGAYKRCNYIHPLYALDGQIITEDFPPDHPHHRGIFWAWHQLYIGDERIGDTWDIKDVSWDIESVKVIDNDGDAKTIQAEVLWMSSLRESTTGRSQAVIRETTMITVFPAHDLYRHIDIDISLLALEKAMRIGGSEDQKGYGGFSTRIRLADDIVFSSATGSVLPQELPIEAGGWLDMSGSIGKQGAKVGFTILCHPDNPGFPNPWILRSAESMQNAVYPHPGAAAVPLSDAEPTTLRYRLLIHEGGLQAFDIAPIHADFAKS